MSELELVTELLSHPGSRWRTLRATGREWRHEARLREAFESGVPGSAVRMTFAGPPAPDEREERWSVWAERPGRIRAEFAIGVDAVVVVFEEDTWWSWAPTLGARTNGGRRNSRHGAGPSAALLETALLASAFRFETVGVGRWLDRRVLDVRAVPLPLPTSVDGLQLLGAQHRLGSGADEHLLTVDTERGVLLRAEARRGGEPFRVVEMTTVAFDEDLPAGTFAIALPPGVVFNDSDDGRPVSSR